MCVIGARRKLYKCRHSPIPPPSLAPSPTSHLTPPAICIQSQNSRSKSPPSLAPALGIPPKTMLTDLDPYLALSRLKLSSYSIQFFLLIVAEYFFGRYGTGKGCLITEGARVCGAGGQNCGRFCGGYCNLGSKHVLTHVLETFFKKKSLVVFGKRPTVPRTFFLFSSLSGGRFLVCFSLLFRRRKFRTT